MRSHTRFSGLTRCLRSLARPLAILSIWLISLGFFGMAYTFGGRRHPRSLEILDFIGAFAVAAAISAIIALVLGGRRRWAFESMLSILITVLTPVGGACVLFWLAPTLGQSLLAMSARDFLSFRRELLESAREIAGLTVPTGTVLGILAGALAGLWLALARRWPRFAGWSAAGLLLACIIGSVHIDAFGRVTDLVVEARLHGSDPLHYAWFMTVELTAAIGATSGAVVGAVISCWAVQTDGRSSRRPPSDRS